MTCIYTNKINYFQINTPLKNKKHTCILFSVYNQRNVDKIRYIQSK